ncbi:hypothetical protein [Vibrio mexicanus]|uniref:hypothetical protein n=1 Tax=Vibrio mexicanus TaxID=1004326 RepID=UPI00063C4F25|nr:hypothetical protein [Vibrio mexicanus]
MFNSKALLVGLMMSSLAACSSTPKPQEISKDASIPMQVVQSVYADRCYEDKDSAEVQNDGIGALGYAGHIGLGIFNGAGIFGGLSAGMGADSQCGFEYMNHVGYIDASKLNGVQDKDARRAKAIEIVLSESWKALDLTIEDIERVEASCNCTFSRTPKLIKRGKLRIYGYYSDTEDVPLTFQNDGYSIIGIGYNTANSGFQVMPEITIKQFSGEFQNKLSISDSVVPVRYDLTWLTGVASNFRFSKPRLPTNHFQMFKQNMQYYDSNLDLKTHTVVLTGLVDSENLYFFMSPVKGETPYVATDNPKWLSVMTPKGHPNPI